MNNLINNLIRQGYLKNDLVIDAFSEISRIEFLPEELEHEALADIALPIGYGQTISQPRVVASMLEFLDAKRDQNVLDIGSGSGWMTALLCYIVGRKGKVTAIERIKELMEWGKNNVSKYNYLKNDKDGIVEFHCTDGKEGFLENAPYDRIIVSASFSVIPESLKNQLKIGGRMVIPIRNSLVYLEKRGENDFYTEEYPGYTFVPSV